MLMSQTTGGEVKITDRPQSINKTHRRRRAVPKPNQSPYPALATWKRRNEHPRLYDRWKYNDLWRAACCEAEAAENANDHPKRENNLQREAIAFMLGVPMHKVKLDLEWQRKYLASLEAGE